MKTLCSAVVLLFLHQVFCTSASVIEMDNPSHWMKFCARVDKVTFTDNEDYRAAVCNNLYETVQEGHGECCSTSDYIPINPAKGYKFSVYIKSTGLDMTNSFGFNVYNEKKEDISTKNQYFKHSDNDSNLWTKWTGYILPPHVPDSNNDGKPDSQFNETNGDDWKWPRDARYVALRIGSCGSGPASTSDAVPVTSDVSSITPTPDPDPSRQTPYDETWYLFLSYQEFETPLRPGHVGVWTFDILDYREWDTKPNYTGKGYVNAHDIHTPIAKMVEGKERKCYYPWGITHLFEIDSNKTYEFSVWILSIQTDLHNFLGFRAYDEDKNLLSFPLPDSDYLQYYSNITTKPYFKRTNNDTKEWTRWNGYVLPDGTDDIPSHFRNGRTWVWPQGAKYAQLRFGTCYGKGNDQGITYFALPRVVQTDLQPN